LSQLVSGFARESRFIDLKSDRSSKQSSEEFVKETADEFRQDRVFAIDGFRKPI
jgi:hypothetical protein